jgi:hypothetical protein
MNLELAQLTDTIMDYLPNLLAALAILIIGWFVAIVVSKLVEKALKKTDIDNQLMAWISGDQGGEAPDTERIIGRIVYYLILLLVIVGFFEALGLTIVTEPLNRLLGEVFAFIPRLAAPVLLLLVAWGLATGLRFVVRRLLDSTELDERLTRGARLNKQVPLSKTLADSVYWLVFLLFLPAVLGVLGLQGLLSPVQHMIDEFLGFLPNLFGAAVILAIGWLVARIVQRIVSGLLSAVGVDSMTERAGLENVFGKQPLSELIGLILYALILIPVIIASLNALSLDAVTRPASQMLETMMAAIPSLLGAALVLVVAYLVGKVVSGLVTNVLAGIGFDHFVSQLGLKISGNKNTPSSLVGYLVLLAIIFFAAVEAAELLGFNMLSDLVADFIVFAGQVVLALILFAVGLFLANLVYGAVSSSGTLHASLLATAARVAILVLAGSMSLRQIGVASDIINLAFGLILGAVAVAVAVAFGLGGREIAAKQLEEWQARLSSGKDESTQS